MTSVSLIGRCRELVGRRWLDHLRGRPRPGPRRGLPARAVPGSGTTRRRHRGSASGCAVHPADRRRTRPDHRRGVAGRRSGVRRPADGHLRCVVMLGSRHRRGPSRLLPATLIMVAADVGRCLLDGPPGRAGAGTCWPLAAIFVALACWVRRDLGAVSVRQLLVITVAVQLTGLAGLPAHQRRRLPLRLGRPGPAGRHRPVPVRATRSRPDLAPRRPCCSRRDDRR